MKIHPEDNLEEKLITALYLLSEPYDPERPQAVVYGLDAPDKPTYLSIETTLRILSLDVSGKLSLQNPMGNGRVAQIGNIFFKYNPIASHLEEQAVHQLDNWLGGGLTTPSRLLIIKLDGIPECEEAIASCALTERTLGVQASLAIEGINLDYLLRMPEAFRMFQALIGEKQWAEQGIDLLSDEYYQRWCEQEQIDTESDEVVCKQLTAFIEPIASNTPEQLPKDFIGYQQSLPEHKKKIMLGGVLGSQSRYNRSILHLLALLKDHPLNPGFAITELIHAFNALRHLKELYPYQTMEQIAEEIPKLLQLIDIKQWSRFFFLTLFARPSDHKQDNFIGRIIRDSNRELTKIEIVGIDNDRLFVDPIVESTENKHEALVRTIIYTFQDYSKKQVPEEIRQPLLSKLNKIELLEWLNRLHQYSSYYETLKKQGIISSELYEELGLNRQLRENQTKVLLCQLSQLQELLSAPGCIHQHIFEQMEPLLSHYYQQLIAYYPDAVSLLYVLYESPPSLEEILTEEQDKIQLAAIHIKERDCEIKTQLFEQGLLDVAGLISFNCLSVAEQEKCLKLLSSLPEDLQDKLSLRAIHLDANVFVRGHLTEGEQFLKKLKKFPAVSLQFRSSEQSETTQQDLGTVKLTDPQLLHILIPLNNADLIQAVIDYGTDLEYRHQDNCTPIHLATQLNYINILQILIKAGALPDKHDAQHLTPLDKALHGGHTECTELLLSSEAKQFQATHGISFIEQHQETHVPLCQKLLKTNSDLLWELSLIASQQEEAPQEAWRRASYYSPSQNRTGYLTESIHKNLFPTEKSKFPSQYEGQGRRHNADIKIQSCKLDIKIHLKEKPELAGREIMVSTLARMLFGNKLTPQVQLCHFTRQIDGFLGWAQKYEHYPVLASRYISNITLRDALTTNPKILKRIDKTSIYQAILLSMLINPEDGRDENYMLEPYILGEETHYRLVCIDNDRSFVPPIKMRKMGGEKEGKKSLVVKTILYCFDEMEERLPDTLRDYILSIDPKELLTNWLQELQQQQEVIKKLFSDTEREKFKKDNLYLDIVFKESILFDIYQKLYRIQSALREEPSHTLMQLLRKVIPSLGIRYREAFEHYDADNVNRIKERFDELTKNCFDHEVVQVPIALEDEMEPEEESPPIARYQETYQSKTKTSTTEIIAMTADLDHAWERRTREKGKTPEELQLSLEVLHQSTDKLREIQNELQRGETKQFTELRDNDDKERIINGLESGLSGIDFSLMKTETGEIDTQCQKKVLVAMRNIPFRRLILRECEQLTDDHFYRILKSCQHLEALALSLTPKTTSQSLAMIARTTKQIEKLRLAHLKDFDFSNLKKPYLFERLRILQIDDCPNLQLLPIDAIRLNQLNITGCPKFKHQKLFMDYPFLLKYAGFLKYSTKAWLEELSKNVIQGSIREKNYAQLSIEGRNQLSNFVEKIIIEAERQINGVISTRPKNEIEETQKLQILVKAGQATPKVIDLIFRMLENPKSATTIENSTNALLDLGCFSEKLTDILRKYLECEIPDNSEAATNVLNQLTERVNTAKLMHWLKSWLADYKRVARTAATNVLDRLIETANLDELMTSLKLWFSDIFSLQTSIDTLKRIVEKTNPTELIPLLKPLLNDPNQYIREAVTGTLRILADKINLVELMLLLKPRLDDPASPVNQTATKILKEKVEQTSASELIPLSKEWLEDSNGNVRRIITEALGRFVEKTDPIELMPLLQPRLKDPDEQVRRTATKTLGELTEKADLAKLMPLLQPWLKDPDEHIRYAATFALGMLVNKIKLDELMALLQPQSKDSDEDVRQVTIDALERIAEKTDLIELMPLLQPWLGDSDDNVRRAATKALAKLAEKANPADLMPLLQPWLENSNEHIREAATKALAKLAEKADLAKLMPLLKQCLEASSRRINKAATEILDRLVAKTDLAELMPLLKPWLGDSDDDVRRAATKALETTGRFSASKLSTTKLQTQSFFSKSSSASSTEKQQTEKPKQKDEASITSTVFTQGLSYQPILRDGHCLYRAVTYYLGHGEDVTFLRNAVANKLENNPELCGFARLPEGKTRDDYIADIRETNVWADNLEIHALMHVLDRPIVIIGLDGKIQNQHETDMFDGEPIFVCYNRDLEHYDSFVLDGTQDAREILREILTELTRSVELPQHEKHKPTSSPSPQGTP
jgi:HEAT repeat protein